MIELFNREYSQQYTCNEFACEAWKQITSKDLSKRIEKFLNGKGRFKRLDKPISPCLVFFKNNEKSSTHVGLFYCDKVLHLTESGVQYVSMRSLKNYYIRFRFYEHVNHL